MGPLRSDLTQPDASRPRRRRLALLRSRRLRLGRDEKGARGGLEPRGVQTRRFDDYTAACQESFLVYVEESAAQASRGIDHQRDGMDFGQAPNTWDLLEWDR